MKTMIDFCFKTTEESVDAILPNVVPKVREALIKEVTDGIIGLHVLSPFVPLVPLKSERLVPIESSCGICPSLI